MDNHLYKSFPGFTCWVFKRRSSSSRRRMRLSFKIINSRNDWTSSCCFKNAWRYWERKWIWLDQFRWRSTYIKSIWLLLNRRMMSITIRWIRWWWLLLWWWWFWWINAPDFFLHFNITSVLVVIQRSCLRLPLLFTDLILKFIPRREKSKNEDWKWHRAEDANHDTANEGRKGEKLKNDVWYDIPCWISSTEIPRRNFRILIMNHRLNWTNWWFIQRYRCWWNVCGFFLNRFRLRLSFENRTCWTWFW